MCTVRRSHNTFGGRCFAPAGPRLWNSLLSKLQQCDSLEEFKRLLRHTCMGTMAMGTMALCEQGGKKYCIYFVDNLLL